MTAIEIDWMCDEKSVGDNQGYIWWTHQRGSFHYDVMVTLILLFIFVTPHFINYKDKPAERLPRPKSVLVMPDGDNG